MKYIKVNDGYILTNTTDIIQMMRKGYANRDQNSDINW